MFGMRVRLSVFGLVVKMMDCHLASLSLLLLSSLTSGKSTSMWKPLKWALYGVNRCLLYMSCSNLLMLWIITTVIVHYYRKTQNCLFFAIIISTPCLKKKLQTYFLSELCQISTDCKNFWHKDSRENKLFWGVLIFHLT